MTVRGWILAILTFACAAFASLWLGLRGGGLADVIQALTAPDPENLTQIAIREIRAPRLIAGTIAGAALGVAGAVSQAATRNPLADPGLMGVNAGAAAAVVLGAAFLASPEEGLVALLVFPGAALTALTVFMLGGGSGGPVRLTLAGLAIGAFLSSIVAGLVLTRGDLLDALRFWSVGTLAQASSRPLGLMACAATAGTALALILAPKIELLALGDDLARGLGANAGLTRLGALAAVALTAGAAVAVAGPISFLGLLAPPLARLLSGRNLRDEIAASALFGAALLLAADTAGRLVFAPAEVRAGIMTALIGGPVFIWIARTLRPGGRK